MQGSLLLAVMRSRCASPSASPNASASASMPLCAMHTTHMHTVPYPAGSASWALQSLCETDSGAAGDLGTVLQAKLLSDVLELVERSLPLLPRRMGASLAVEASLCLVEHVNCALDCLPVQPSSPSSPSSVSVSVSALGSLSAALLCELRGAWTKVFESALLHGDMYAEALDALLHLAELENQDQQEAQEQTQRIGGIGSGRAVPWRDCLRTLVAQACDCGRLGWLCSVPDRQLPVSNASNASTSTASAGPQGSQGGQGGTGGVCLSLSDAVASTLEQLGATLDVPLLPLLSAPSDSNAQAKAQQGVSWAECLFAFQLAHRKFRDAARALHTYVRRIDSEAHTQGAQGAQGAKRRLTAQVGPLAAALGALLVLPVQQQYLLFREGAGSEAVLDWRDARELALLFSVRRAAHSLLEDSQGQNAALGPVELSQAISSPSPERLVLALSNTGRLGRCITIIDTIDTIIHHILTNDAYIII
jgi:hypothetical protein